MKQVFFNGDGLTADQKTQQVVVPDGATRFYLGTGGGTGRFDNSGSFSVQANESTGGTDGTGENPGGSTVLRGDLNGDGKSGVQDATLSLRITAGLLTPTDAQSTSGDVNGDDKGNIQDAPLSLQWRWASDRGSDGSFRL